MQTTISPSSLSKALSSALNLKQLHKIHALTIISGLERSVFFSGKLITKYSHLKDPFSSLSLFRQLSPTTNVYLWNSVIRALSQNGLFSKSLELYHKMEKMELFFPDRYTFPSVINSCAGLLDIERGKCVHDRVLEMGFGLDLYICNALIDMYARLGFLDQARKVFDGMPERDVVSWNSLVSGYSSNAYWEEALEVYRQSRVSGLVPDSFMVSSILRACGGLGVVGEGKVIHGLVEKVGLDLDVVVSNGLLSMYMKFEKLLDARRVFNEMVVRDNVSYNTIICGYYQLDFIEESVELFKEMVDRFQPDILTITSVLRACGYLQDLQQGKFVHNYMLRVGFKHDATTGNILIDMYAKCGDLVSMRDVFASMKSRDSVSWNSLINGYVQNGDFSKVMKLVKMLKREVKADSVTYLMLLSVSTHVAYLDFGGEIHSEAMKSGFSSDVSISNALINMYAKCGEVSDALKVFDDMKIYDIVTWNTVISACVRSGDFTTAMQMISRMRNSGVIPDVATILGILPMCSSLAVKRQGREVHGRIFRLGFESHVSIGNALIEMYSKCGTLKKSVQVFEHMKLRDVVTWTALIYAYGMYGEGEKALETFSEMETTGIIPDHVAFVAIIYACSHSGMLEEGLSCFDRMKSYYNIEPQIEHYACVVDLLSRSRQIAKAEEFICAMPMKPDTSIWASLLSACRASGDMETAERVSKRIIELNPQDSGYSILASNAYAAMGQWDKVSLIRKSVRAKGLKKDPGCSWIEIKKRIHVFRAGDQLVEQFEQIYKLLEVLSNLMAKEGYVADLRCALHKVDEDEKKQMLCGHSERLAIAFGLLNSEPETPLQVMKNLRVCGDCHTAIKYMSKIVNREILVRDANRFHLFKDGTCSCGDRW